MKTLPFVSLLALAACGDNHRNVPDAGPPGEAGGTPSRAVVVVGDFNPGDFGALSTLASGGSGHGGIALQDSWISWPKPLL